MDNEKIIGQTKSVGFQIGVRRTFPISQEQAWALITTTEGVRTWLGKTLQLYSNLGTNTIQRQGQAKSGLLNH